MSDVVSPSRNIYRGVRVASLAGEQCEAIKNELERIIKGLEHPTFVGRYESDDSEDDADGWVCLTDLVRYWVEQKNPGGGRRTRVGKVSFVFDLGFPNGLADKLERAVAIVAWASGNGGWGIEDLVGDWVWQIREGEGTKARRILLEDRRRPVYLYNEGYLSDNRKTDWWYALPLDSINERKDIRQLLVDPIFDLLDGKPDDAVFGRRREDFICFEDSEGQLAPTTQAIDSRKERTRGSSST